MNFIPLYNLYLLFCIAYLVMLIFPSSRSAKSIFDNNHLIYAYSMSLTFNRKCLSLSDTHGDPRPKPSVDTPQYFSKIVVYWN